MARKNRGEHQRDGETGRGEWLPKVGRWVLLWKTFYFRAEAGRKEGDFPMQNAEYGMLAACGIGQEPWHLPGNSGGLLQKETKGTK
jgi:hypothetical protein